MPHDKEYVIRLNGLDLGQLIDGLEARATAWRLTATYLETGEAPDGFVVEECGEPRKPVGLLSTINAFWEQSSNSKPNSAADEPLHLQLPLATTDGPLADAWAEVAHGCGDHG